MSESNKLNNSIISFCLISHYNEKYIKDLLYIEEKLASKVRGLRLIVSAAGKLLVQEAGGRVTNLNGDLRENIDTMLVTNGKIHEEIVSAIKNNA